MGERRREVERLGLLLERVARREARIAVALLELERHPWYLVLDAGGARGRTARRWEAARATRDGLWRDFSRLCDVLRSGEKARDRRRPGDADVAELQRRLAEATALVGRIGPALHEIRALVGACAATSESVTAAVASAAECLTAARRVVAELELGPGDPDVVALAGLTAQACERERDAATDPLAFAGTPPAGGLAAGVDALRARLDALSRMRAEWDTVPSTLDRELDELAGHRSRVVRADGRARAQLRDTVPVLPPDRAAALLELRRAVTAATGWRERHDAVVALRERIAGARSELDRAADLVAGLIERRDDLRGRFGAYRARTRRLARTDDPELTELAGRIGSRLWSVPAELARATRDLAAYRRRLAVLSAS